MKPATRLIHVAEGIREDAAPLTTPIYETTTFVFENAQEVRDYNEGRSTKFLYSRYANPTVLAVEARDRRARGRRERARLLERTGGDDDRAPGAPRRRRRSRVQRRDLRRHPAPHLRPAAEVRHPPALRVDRRAPSAGRRSCRRRRRWSGSSRRSTRRCAAWTSPRWRRRAARAASPRSSTTPSPARSISSPSRSASTS